MKYWLMKTEPDVFSLDDLKAAGTEPWDGVRNYQARNLMRDQMEIGDRIFIYHSRAKPMGIVGEARVASKAYPDPTQFNPEEKYYDPKADPANPRWVLVDVEYVRHYPEMITLAQLKEIPELGDMMLVQKGSRLSIQPVSEAEWKLIESMVAG